MTHEAEPAEEGERGQELPSSEESDATMLRVGAFGPAVPLAGDALDLDRVEWVSPPMTSGVELNASALIVLYRTLRWTVLLVRLLAVTLWDLLQGDFSVPTRAHRLRQAFRWAGGSVLKLGQQLSLRADILPYEYCVELSKLLDQGPPIPWPEAEGAIERNLGRPLSQVFAHIEPRAVGSASVACVYRARLLDGREVAVKLRRPDIVDSIAADIAIFQRTARWIERLGIVRPGFATTVVAQLGNMLAEELDFRREGRYLELFRAGARRVRVKWLTAPRPVFELTTTEMLVMEYVRGVPGTELLAAVDRQDEAALTSYREMGIDPKVIAQRMIVAWNWQVFRFPIFHGDPHPANMRFLPGNKIVLLDFGACGYFTSPGKRVLREVQAGLMAGDVSRMVKSVMHLLEPFPPMAIESFQAELEGLYADFLFAVQSKHSAWWEKATSRIWLSYIRLARQYQVSVTMDTLRLFRATFLMDTVAFRLDPKLRLRKAYRAFLKAEDRHARKAYARGGMAALGVMEPFTLHRAAQALDSIDRTRAALDAFLDAPSFRFTNLTGKVAYVGLVVFRYALVLTLGTLAMTALVMYGRLPSSVEALETFGDDPSLGMLDGLLPAVAAWANLTLEENLLPAAEAFAVVIGSPIYSLALALGATLFVFRIRRRMSDVEVNK